MNLFLYIIIFTTIGSIVSLIGGILLLLKPKFTENISHLLASFAAGALLATAFFDLLPEAVEESAHLGIEVGQLFVWVLVGILFFFLFERTVHWFHHHQHEHEKESAEPVVALIIVGDTIHNFIDGVVIAATFLVSIPLGIITALAVGAHEIPQEIGDFGVLLKKGMKTKKVLLVNIVSALTALLGAVLTFFAGERIEGLALIFLPITAGFFIYIALSDLVPEIHHENRKGFAVKETVMLILGVVVVYFVINAVHSLGLHEEAQIEKVNQVEIFVPGES